MRPPGIVIQLDELEYFLPGPYPGVVLAIEGKLPFQGLGERLHDGVVVRAALAGKRLESCFRIFPVHNIVKGVDYQILIDAGDTCHPTILHENRSRQVAR